jgi:hypothetical protein
MPGRYALGEFSLTCASRFATRKAQTDAPSTSMPPQEHLEAITSSQPIRLPIFSNETMAASYADDGSGVAPSDGMPDTPYLLRMPPSVTAGNALAT